jgi:hypothetical protein
MRVIKAKQIQPVNTKDLPPFHARVMTSQENQQQGTWILRGPVHTRLREIRSRTGSGR